MLRMLKWPCCSSFSFLSIAFTPSFGGRLSLNPEVSLLSSLLLFSESELETSTELSTSQQEIWKVIILPRHFQESHFTLNVKLLWGLDGINNHMFYEKEKKDTNHNSITNKCTYTADIYINVIVSPH